MVTLGSILCPVDFSEPSRRALRCAGALARRSRGRVIVLSAVDPLLAEAAKVRFGLVLAQTETEPALDGVPIMAQTMEACYCCRSGGMADALDSKSSWSNPVWVQLPPPVLLATKRLATLIPPWISIEGRV